MVNAIYQLPLVWDRCGRGGADGNVNYDGFSFVLFTIGIWDTLCPVGRLAAESRHQADLCVYTLYI